jgi:hypothetical protein
MGQSRCVYFLSVCSEILQNITTVRNMCERKYKSENTKAKIQRKTQHGVWKPLSVFGWCGSELESFVYSSHRFQNLWRQWRWGCRSSLFQKLQVLVSAPLLSATSVHFSLNRKMLGTLPYVSVSGSKSKTKTSCPCGFRGNRGWFNSVTMSDDGESARTSKRRSQKYMTWSTVPRLKTMSTGAHVV